MGLVELNRAAGLAFREAVPEGAESGDPVLLLHGFPESSLMWEPVMSALAEAGRRSLAPDLYCLGESADPGPATFERNRDALFAFGEELGLDRVALVVHDWGGFVGLAWACERPGAASALVISDTGFFPDARWHSIAATMRGPEGDELIEALDRDGFATILRSGGASFDDATVDAYWRPFAEGRGREATLEFYRSMDFEKLARYDGKLGELGVPTLLLWGERDKFASMGSAKRFEREIPGARLVALDADHFVFDEQPERCAEEVVSFLTG